MVDSKVNVFFCIVCGVVSKMRSLKLFCVLFAHLAVEIRASSHLRNYLPAVLRVSDDAVHQDTGCFARGAVVLYAPSAGPPSNRALVLEVCRTHHLSLFKIRLLGIDHDFSRCHRCGGCWFAQSPTAAL
jgi:hypothetical protein